MKMRIIIAVLLVLLIGELLWLSSIKQDEYAAAMEQYNADIQAKTDALAEKQAVLDALSDADALAKEAEAARLSESAGTLKAEAQALAEQIEALMLTLEEKQQAVETSQEDLAYYTEVYDALKEGLEKVEGYIAGN